jgi:outer membrane protein assembly factor BamB
MRTACRSGHVFANGFTYRPSDHCQCYMRFQPRGFAALRASADAGGRVEDEDRLVKGPAYGEVPDAAAADPASWPTFRHDAMRSAMATCRLPAAPRTTWSIAVGSRPTAPVVAEGKVFVGSRDSHRVFAFDAKSGEESWAFTADARVDSPPSVWEGHVVFGCRDGRVYCLRSSDGALVWRFVAAPTERKIVAFGGLVSLWPVNGSVLIAGGRAHFVAGRASVLDGGVYAYALDVSTGRMLGSERIHEVQTETKSSGSLPDGALEDVLTTNGRDIFLRGRKLNLPPVEGVGPAELAAVSPVVSSSSGFLTERWFHRAFWDFKSSTSKAKGNLIAFDPKRAYVATANHPGSPNQTFHIPSGGSADRVAGVDGDGPRWLANPDLQVGGTILFAARSNADGKDAPSAPVRSRGRGKARKTPAAAIWRHDHFPMYPWSMVVGDGKLVVAGIPGEVDPKEPWATFEGQRGGQLSVLDSGTGRVVARHELSAPPVWNGMAAANGLLYVSQMDGRLVCIGE